VRDKIAERGLFWTIISAVAAVVGVIVTIVAIFINHHDAERDNTSSPTVSKPPANTSLSPVPSNKSKPGQEISLADIQPVRSSADSHEGKVSPVLSGNRYATGVQLLCSPEKNQSYANWNVTGHDNFVAAVGIDDNTQGVDGTKVKVDYSDENGRILHNTTTVAIGQRAQGVRVSLENVRELQISCVAYDEKNSTKPRSVRIALGDAAVS
jgi:hypothetical protein